jgi:uncharacterized RDD family membrane protein YckC
MNTPPEHNRFAPPTAHVEDIQTNSLELAGRGARLGATLIDGLIQLVLYFGLVFTVFPALMPTEKGGLLITTVLPLGLSYLLFFLLHGYLLVTQGQTLGKKMLDLRIVRSNGGRVSPIRLIGVRYVLNGLLSALPWVGWFYILVDSLMIFRASHQCLHDSMADTIVIKA